MLRFNEFNENTKITKQEFDEIAKKDWNRWQDDAHEDDKMGFTDFLDERKDFYIEKYGYYWDWDQERYIDVNK